MESIRQKKVGKLLQKELGEWFRENASFQFKGSLIGVTGVRVSADFSVAKIYLSLYPPDKKNEVFNHISESSFYIRKELGARIRKNLRIVPELHFYIDDSLDYAERIESLLKK